MQQAQRHPAFAAVFSPGELSFGLVLPLTGPGETRPEPARQLDLARLADRSGFSALWVRDVPLNSPAYPDPVEHMDPWVHLGALAAATARISLVTGAIVSPLRHPVHVAKAALSVDHLSKGRFLLGLGAGDRPGEFRAFGRDVSSAGALFRDNWERIARLVDGEGVIDPTGATADADAKLLPRPVHGSIPMLSVGSAGQTIGWIARNASAWATYYRPFARQRDRYALWKSAAERTAPGAAPAFATSFRLVLEEAAAAPPRQLEFGLQTGRDGLVDELAALRDMGAQHVMFNLTDAGRPVEEVMQELAAEVFAQFSRRTSDDEEETRRYRGL